MPCPFRNGAAAVTCGFADASRATSCQSASRLFWPLICTCATTPRMRARTSFWNPFITDSTTMSAHTPTAMPSMDATEMNEMK